MNESKGIASTVNTEKTEAKNINDDASIDEINVDDVKAMLKVTKDGNVRQTIANCRIVLENNPLFKGAIRKNELSGRTDIVKETNRKRSTIAFDDTDFNYILLHMEEKNF